MIDSPLSIGSEGKTKITEFQEEELRNWAVDQGEKPFRATQLFQWLYKHKTTSLEKMNNLAKTFRQKIEANFSLEAIPIVHQELATDGTIKYLQKLWDGYEIESVVMKHKDHYTVCVSTQVGCAIGCKFCMTATMGLKRNLTPGEIVDQVRNGFSLLPEGETIRNIVYMGMGEPFHNFNNTIKSLEILLNPTGFDFSSRRITVSTSGLIPQIKKFLYSETILANLAISLNGVNQEERRALMPISKRYPIEELMATIRELPDTYRRRVTFEYILIGEVTDSISAAKKLVKLLHGTKSKVNLIFYNNNPELGFHAPEEGKVQEFQKYLLDHGVLATLRISKGQDISAACGQLATQSEGNKASKSEVSP